MVLAFAGSTALPHGSAAGATSLSLLVPRCGIPRGRPTMQRGVLGLASLRVDSDKTVVRAATVSFPEKGLGRRSSVLRPLDKLYTVVVRLVLALALSMGISASMGKVHTAIPEHGLLGELAGIQPRVELVSQPREMGSFYMWRNVNAMGALPDQPFFVTSPETADALLAVRTKVMAAMCIAFLVTSHALWQDG